MKAICVFIVGTVTLLYFCSPKTNNLNISNLPLREPISTKVIYVMARSITTNQEDNGHPITGAIVGGMLAGKKGAIVGAIVGDQIKENTPQKTNVVGCSVVLKIYDGTNRSALFTTEGEDMYRCLALHVGDSPTVFFYSEHKICLNNWPFYTCSNDVY